MSLGARLGPRTNTRPRDVAAWPVALLVLAFAMPLNSAIGAEPFFLRTHSLNGWQYLALQVALTALGWLALWGLTSLLRRLASAAVFDAVASVGTLLLAWFAAANGLGSEPHLRSWGGSLSTWLWVIVGLVVAVLVTLLSRRASAGIVLLVFTTVVSAFPIAIASINASSSAVQASVTWSDATEQRPSVLWIIADELNDHALIGPDGLVHPAFPNLRALQEQSTTYEQTYSLSNKTERAIPAMMAGLPDIGAQSDGTMNSLGDSDGIVGLLGDQYSVTFSSSIFAPPAGVSSCNADGASVGGQLGTFAADLAAVAGNTTLLEPLRGYFPPTEAKWRDFWTDTSPGWTSVARERLRCQAESDAPFFAVWHTLTTHNPYIYGRDGSPLVLDPQHTLAVIDPGMNVKGEVTTPDLYEFQRRLYGNSIANLDRRVGQILDVLKQSGRYDDTMVIFTADHGVALTEARRDGSGGEDERRVGADDAQMWGEIAHVPLIVKYPGQQDASTVEAARASSQILPTALQQMGATATLPWPLQPPLDQDPSAIVFTLRHLGSWTSHPFTSPGRWDEWTDQQLEPDPQYPFAIGIDPALLGKPVPAGSAAVDVRTTVAPGGSSTQRLFQFRTAGRCPADASLLAVDKAGVETVVGSVLWEAGDGPAARGWAILPSSLGTDVRVYCAP